MDAGEVGREDELVAQVVHDLQQAEDKEVGDALGLGARTTAEKWKSWEVDFKCARHWIRGPSVCFIHFTENSCVGVKIDKIYFFINSQYFPFFVIKRGHFITYTILFMCYKHSSLQQESKNEVKTMFGRVDLSQWLHTWKNRKAKKCNFWCFFNFFY